MGADVAREGLGRKAYETGGREKPRQQPALPFLMIPTDVMMAGAFMPEAAAARRAVPCSCSLRQGR